MLNNSPFDDTAVSCSIMWGLYCPPVIPAELCQSSGKWGWFSEVDVGRWVSPELSRTETSPEGWISPLPRTGPGLRGFYCKLWENHSTCKLTCEFKHHTNVTTCDITSFFNQPQPQPNNTTNGNHDMTPNANNNPQKPCHHNQPKNKDNHPQTKMAAHKWQQTPTKTNDSQVPWMDMGGD